MVTEVVPLQLMEGHDGADIHAVVHGEEPTLEQVFWTDL